jgi:DNA replication and repair protein RecF
VENYRIHRLQLTNFRNINNSVIEFDSKINCIFGQNGNGKTNILEAIYFLAYKKSFRKNTAFPQLLDTDSEKPEIYINSTLTDEYENDTAYSLRLTSEEFQYFKDSKAIKRKLKIPAIFINPFDSFQYHQQSSFRRNLVDQYLGVVDDEYRSLMARYQKCMRQRNALLSHRSTSVIPQLNAINEQYIRYISEITTLRVKYVENLNEYITTIYQELFSEEHDLELQLQSDFIGKTKEEIKLILDNALTNDLERGHSTKGVHRDDFITLFDDFNAFEYCSLGQQKMSFLSLLFAYIDLFRYKKGSFPVVLIDDVSGELDQERWNRLIRFIEKRSFQVVITTANDAFREKLEALPDVKKFRVDAGDIRLDQ